MCGGGGGGGRGVGGGGGGGGGRGVWLGSMGCRDGDCGGEWGMGAWEVDVSV